MSRILVADDNVELCHALKSALEKAGHSVELSHDGADAIRKQLA